jgi:hypothetical protein
VSSGDASATRPAEPPVAGWLKQRWRGRREKKEVAVRDRALRNLECAVREAGPELSPVWVARADPDLEFFRVTKDERFDEIVESLPQALIKQVGDGEAVGLLLSVRDRKPIEAPARPWGDPRVRFRRWAFVVGAYAVVVLVPAVWATGLSLMFVLLLVPLVLPVWRLVTARRERRVEWTVAAKAPQRLPEPAPAPAPPVRQGDPDADAPDEPSRR